MTQTPLPPRGSSPHQPVGLSQTSLSFLQLVAGVAVTLGGIVLAARATGLGIYSVDPRTELAHFVEGCGLAIAGFLMLVHVVVRAAVRKG
jgi:hypothetical protein